MNSRSPLFGRRIHISGSVPDDLHLASAEAVEEARRLLQGLVAELVKVGANFVVPVDAEKRRKVDGRPICFDWLIWQTLRENLARRPSGATNPLVVAIQHHKNEDQIPPEFQALWDELRFSDCVQIESAAFWNMASKRMEAQARWGDVLVTLGGGEGVLFLANIYHDAGKPVVPLNLPLCDRDTGAQRLFNFSLAGGNATRLFRTEDARSSAWLNRIKFRNSAPIETKIEGILTLLDALELPRAFAVRLLNKTHAEFLAVEEHFESVVRPIVEGELGFKMIVVDGDQPLEHARIDQEIFEKLHRSQLVIADITGMRPNCFIELGFGLGRGLPTLVMAKLGSDHPFDIASVSGLHWDPSFPLKDRKMKFREHWHAVRNRPPLVKPEPMFP